MRNTPLDWIVFAAPKSATTTLHTALVDHPQLALPTNKELPFFCDDRLYNQGIKSLEKHFDNQREIRGTISPQYGIGKDTNREETADRIAKALPDVKLVALLRHPVKRAYSHHKMLTSRQHETRSFEQAISDCLDGKPNVGTYSDPDMDYVLGSSYGSLLQVYYDRFSESNIKVLFTEDLIESPTETVNSLLSWLGLDPFDQPVILDNQRSGGSQPKLAALTPGKLFSIPGVRSAWQKTPTKLTRPIEYRLNLWNTKPDDSSLDRESAIYTKLKDSLASEVKLLESLTGLSTPWSDWR